MKVVRCGTLIDGTGQAPQSKVALLIEDAGTIASVESDGNRRPLQSSEVMDLSAYTIMPGIVDAHDHLGVDLGKEEEQAHEPDGLTVLRASMVARQVLAAGITTMRYVGDKHHIDMSLKKAIHSGLIPGPRLVVSGEYICKTGGHGWSGGREADGPDGMRKAVRDQIKAGADLIKLMVSGGISTEGSSPLRQELADDEIRAAIDEAHRAGRKVSGHLHGGPAVKVAVEAGIDSIEHGVYLTDADLALLASAGTYLVVTYGVMAFGARADDMPAYLKEKITQACEVYLDTIRRAIKAGVNIAFGGDTYHGHPVEELQALVAAGYSEMDAILAGTKKGAELCGVANRVGTLEKGKWADLIALDGDPLLDISAVGRVKAVVKGGVLQAP